MNVFMCDCCKRIEAEQRKSKTILLGYEMEICGECRRKTDNFVRSIMVESPGDEPTPPTSRSVLIEFVETPMEAESMALIPSVTPTCDFTARYIVTNLPDEGEFADGALTYGGEIVPLERVPVLGQLAARITKHAKAGNQFQIKVRAPHKMTFKACIIGEES